jgi:hypothetical protein
MQLALQIRDLGFQPRPAVFTAGGVELGPFELGSFGGELSLEPRAGIDDVRHEPCSRR